MKKSLNKTGGTNRLVRNWYEREAWARALRNGYTRLPRGAKLYFPNFRRDAQALSEFPHGHQPQPLIDAIIRKKGVRRQQERGSGERKKGDAPYRNVSLHGFVHSRPQTN